MLLDEKKDIKRAAIYVFFDKDGIIDDYVPEILRGMKKAVTHLLVIINGKVNEESLNKISDLCDDLLIRENNGYDVTAYSEGLKRIGLDKLKEYDEIVLFNSTLFGPICPFEIMFDEMGKRDVDFWGILKHYATHDTSVSTSKYGYVPEHIQSYFMVFRKSLTSSYEFKAYFEKLPQVKDYDAARGKFEIEFTKDFADKGFSYDTYIDMSRYEGYSSNFIMWIPDVLLKKGCPVVKQKSFSFGTENMVSTSAIKNCLSFINEKTDYDISLIWQNILRTQNMHDIKNMLNLNIILPKYNFTGKRKECKALLVTQLKSEASLAKMINIIKRFPSYFDVIVIAYEQMNDSFTKELAFKNIEIKKALEKTAYEFMLLKELKLKDGEYDIICSLPDLESPDFRPYYDGMYFTEKCYENAAASETFIENTVQRIISDPYLGLISPPPLHNGQHETIYPNPWGNEYDNTLNAARAMGLKVNIDKAKPPISALSSVFWARPETLKVLYEHEEECSGNSDTVKRLYGFCVQQSGHYSAWLLNDEYAAQEITSLNYLSEKYAPKQENFLKTKRKLKKIIPSRLIGYLLKVKDKISR